MIHGNKLFHSTSYPFITEICYKLFSSAGQKDLLLDFELPPTAALLSLAVFWVLTSITNSHLIASTHGNPLGRVMLWKKDIKGFQSKRHHDLVAASLYHCLYDTNFFIRTLLRTSSLRTAQIHLSDHHNTCVKCNKTFTIYWRLTLITQWM